MWVMMVFLVATNIQVMSQDQESEAAGRGAAYATVNPGGTYAECQYFGSEPPGKGMYHIVIGLPITDEQH